MSRRWGRRVALLTAGVALVATGAAGCGRSPSARSTDRPNAQAESAAGRAGVADLDVVDVNAAADGADALLARAEEAMAGDE